VTILKASFAQEAFEKSEIIILKSFSTHQNSIIFFATPAAPLFFKTYQQQ
jgi:hypothetical protein